VLTVNEYFDGKVKSIAFAATDLPATVGVMLPGNYTFNTSEREYVTVIEGELRVRLPGSDEWKSLGAADSFTVEAGQSFDLEISSAMAYLCKYEK
jgi:hypothetical protein